MVVVWFGWWYLVMCWSGGVVLVLRCYAAVLLLYVAVNEFACVGRKTWDFWFGEVRVGLVWIGLVCHG